MKRLPPVRPWLTALWAAAALASAACGRQPEGERCSLLNGNQDCDGNLVCTPAGELRGGEDGVDRCCPPDERADADPRCRPRIGAAPGTGGATGNNLIGTSPGGGGGAAGSAP